MFQVIDDSFYFGVEEDEEDTNDPQSFPTTYPFSATVPEIGLALLKVRAALPRPPSPVAAAAAAAAGPSQAIQAR